MSKKNIGIVGAGQAGQRIAIALSKFEDVVVTGIVDSKAMSEVLTSKNSQWFLAGTKFFKNDDEMLELGGYDALVVCVDPISLFFNEKIAFLNRHKFSKPILWERPFGFEPSHPKFFVNSITTVPQNSVISFARYGFQTRKISSVIDSDVLGDVVDIEILATLNCGLLGKKWRHIGGVPLPIHFLDSAFELIEHLNLGCIESLRATEVTVNRERISFDEKWEISISLSSGVTGRILGIQYLGEYEHLYPLRQLRIIGTSGALNSSMGSTAIFDSRGCKIEEDFEFNKIDPRIEEAIESLIEFFRSIDKYPIEVVCRGEAVALAECLRAWVDTLSPPCSDDLMLPATPNDSSHYLSIGKAAVLSAMSGQRLEKKDFP